LDILTPDRHFDLAAGKRARGKAQFAEFITHAQVLAHLDDVLN
jgi:hypothetical protein